MKFPKSIPSQAAETPAVLVSLKTSDTPRSVEIDSAKARFTRLKRSVLVAAKLFEIAFQGIAFRPTMLTLSYKDVDAFEPRHIFELLKRIRHWVERPGQRPADVLKNRRTDIRDGALWVVQTTTGARIEIKITGELAAVIARISERPRRAISPYLIQDENVTCRPRSGVPGCGAA